MQNPLPLHCHFTLSFPWKIFIIALSFSIAYEEFSENSKTLLTNCRFTHGILIMLDWLYNEAKQYLPCKLQLLRH
jgi:hypothetical protein